MSTAYTWLAAGDFDVGFQILVDPLSTVMMLIVSGVGGLIVWYSMGYMAGDDEERRYFAYMSLFVFSMLMLVQAGNFLLLLVGWGLVGLASYLLIGFWHQRPEAVAAAKKAFIMNAVGDATFALALVLLVWETGTLEFFGVFDQADSLSSTTINLVALGLLGGAVAKSAQIPLHTWLPDAMEGPTPVSALIHAATMVTAGVYLLVRAHPIFEVAVDVQHLAAILGTVTLLAAGLIALVQWDIKRVIAYSTMSQIGYMFLAAGIGAYGYAIFHLMTHAFFKALLFMSAGRRHPPPRRRAGHPPDGRPEGRAPADAHRLPRRLARARRHPDLRGLLVEGRDHLVRARDGRRARLDALRRGARRRAAHRACTRSASTSRCSTARSTRRRRTRPSTRRTATARARGRCSSPSAILTVLSTIGGLVVIPGVWEPFLTWIDEMAEPLVHPTVAQDYLTSAIAVTLGLVGFYVARRAFQQDRQLVRKPELWRVFEHKFYFDELYDALFYRPAAALADMLRQRVEEPVIERSLDEIGSGTIQVGGEVARVQSGLLRTYALAIAFAVAVLVVVFVAVR